MGRRALITGITGQDGSLAEFLLERGYEIQGLIRRASSSNTGRVEHLIRDPHESDVRLHLHCGDVTDAVNLTNLVSKIEPDEIYDLAAQSHVRVSFDPHLYTVDVCALGTLRVLQAEPLQARSRVSGLVRRDVRQSGGNASARNDPVLSPQPLCVCQEARRHVPLSRS